MSGFHVRPRPSTKALDTAGQSTSGNGVTGQSSSGSGVRGATSGTSGQSGAAGVWGDSSNYYGVWGTSASADGVHGRVRIAIVDSGSGIPKEVLPTIFEPFVSTKGEKGTGLGLWIVKGIVESHGGRLRVRSTPGRGTIFLVDFPVVRT